MNRRTTATFLAALLFMACKDDTPDKDDTDLSGDTDSPAETDSPTDTDTDGQGPVPTVALIGAGFAGGPSDVGTLYAVPLAGGEAASLFDFTGHPSVERFTTDMGFAPHPSDGML